jgi:PEP-CTERM motif
MMPLPTAFRFFASGNQANITGWDNLSVIPAPGALALLGFGLFGVARRRR